MVRPTDQPRRAEHAASHGRRGLRAATAAGVAAVALLAQGSFVEAPGVVLAAGGPVATAQSTGWAAAGAPGADGGWVGGLASDPRPLAWTTDLSTLMGLVDGVRAAGSRDVEQPTEPGSGWPSQVPLPGTLEARAVYRSVDAALGAHGIPEPALRAYTAAADALASSAPSCGVDWALLAGIGRVETNHGRFAGAVIATSGVSDPAIFGPRLDGSLAGTMVIRDTDSGRLDRDSGYDRAVGPMQFLPGTWGGYASDGDHDGVSDPHDVDDAALAAARYLCAGAGGLDQPAGAARAVRRYNNSAAYVDLVLSLADLFRTGAAVGIPAVPGPSVPGPVMPPAQHGLGLPGIGDPGDLPFAPPSLWPRPSVPLPPVPLPDGPLPPAPVMPPATTPPTPVVSGSPTGDPTSTDPPAVAPGASPPVPATPAPTGEVTASPTPAPTTSPTTTGPVGEPSLPPCEPVAEPGTAEPSAEPDAEPSAEPSVVEPSSEPSPEPTGQRSVVAPTCEPTCEPSVVEPSSGPSVVEPSSGPSSEPSVVEPSMVETSMVEPSGEPVVAEPGAEPTCQAQPEALQEPAEDVTEPDEPEPSGATPAPVSTAPAALATRK